MNPTQWSVYDVSSWLSLIGAERYADAFRNNNIDGRTLLSLTSQHLKANLGVASLNDRKIIVSAISELRTKVGIGATASSAAPTLPPQALTKGIPQEEEEWEEEVPRKSPTKAGGPGRAATYETQPPTQPVQVMAANRAYMVPMVPMLETTVNAPPPETHSPSGIKRQGSRVSFDENSMVTSSGPPPDDDDHDVPPGLSEKEAALYRKERQLQQWEKQLARKEDILLKKQKEIEKASNAFTLEKEQWLKDRGQIQVKKEATVKYSLSPNVIICDEQGVRIDKITSVLKRVNPGINPFLYSKDQHSLDNCDGLMSMYTRDILRREDSCAGMTSVAASKVAKAVLELIETEWQQYQDNAFNSMRNDKTRSFVKLLFSLVEHGSNIVKNDPMCLYLTSPLYVLGDIHGNFGDLQFFMDQLVNFGQLKYTPTKFLFLGDYVDRGMGSVQVAAYTLAMKVLAPTSVFLLRGNHEMWTINGDQQQYGESAFKSCCERLFGLTDGAALWEKFNEFFSLLPLAAIVDDVIFCVHGGIPRWAGGPDQRISALSDPCFPRFYNIEFLPTDTPELRLQKQLAQELMWNDPADEEVGLDEYGFGSNDKRGVNIYSFGLKSIETFLQRFNMQFIIRAHEVKQEGLRVCKNAQVVTVFTSSYYCGGDNAAAAVYVANGKLRFVTHMPSANPPKPAAAKPLLPQWSQPASGRGLAGGKLPDSPLRQTTPGVLQPALRSPKSPAATGRKK